MIAEYKESIDICSDLQTIHERVSEVSIKSALDLTNHSLTLMLALATT